MIIIIGLISGHVNAADFSYSDISPHTGKEISKPIGKYIYINGNIEAGDTIKFQEFIKKDPWEYIFAKGISISSKGGSVADAVKIGDIIKNTYKHIVISRHTGPCLSSCFFVIASATERDIDTGAVGIHRPYYPKEKLENKTLKEVQEINDALYTETKKYLELLNVPRNLSELMLSRTSNEIYWLTKSDKINLGRRPLWYEEFLVTICGFDKELERKFDNPLIHSESVDDEYFSMLEKVDNCSINKVENEKIAYMEQLLKIKILK
ncbi:MAG TPA: hypothetical protein DCO68_13520 [Methylophilaceae bacterium]|nr:hypothetical protein [Methylophilaceae bacterium]HAJ73086.1 hypothetical protein [Methylophilaceae bacterium]